MKYKNKKEKKRRLHRQPKLAAKIFIYLLIFTAVMIGIQWLLQTVFLDNFYHYIKKKEVLSAVENIEKQIDSSDLDGYIDYYCSNSQLCIEVANDAFETVSKGSYDICYVSGFNTLCAVHNNRAFRDKYALMTKARNSGTPYFTENASSKDNLEHSFPFNADENSNRHSDNEVVMPANNDTVMEYVAYFTDADGNGYYIVIESKISSVNTTVQTLRFQLILVSFIFVLIAIVLALIISAHISRPIRKINDGAKELAKGNYEAQFHTKGYEEITELSNSLNHAASELSKVDHLKSELIANISHDLRTPLTMISGYAEVMRDIPGENTPENVQIIIDEATRLTTLVNAVLDLSKIQSGNVPYHPEPTDLTTLIKTIIERYSKMTQTDGYDIRFDFSENLCVNADNGKLQQVLYNLINNAISYTGEDKKILVRQSRCGQNQENVRIEVIDSGAGISKENLQNIWDRYFKENKTHRRAVVGTGLGLSIVKGILELHHARFGVISDESPQHHGSDFWFEMPILSQTEENEDA